MITVFQVAINDEDAFELNQSLQDTYFKLTHRQNGDLIRSVYAGEVNGLNYEKVADVDTTDLDYAYERTNSIDDYWGNNEGVAENGSRHRSTSTGDLMLVNGKFFVVASFGFEEVAIHAV